MTIYSTLLFTLVQTGADGCICHMEYVKLKDQKVLEFIGMKQVKELTSVQSLFYDQNSFLDLTSNLYATGFASTDFIICNLTTEAKVHSLSLSLLTHKNTRFAIIIPFGSQTTRIGAGITNSMWWMAASLFLLSWRRTRT